MSASLAKRAASRAGQPAAGTDKPPGAERAPSGSEPLELIPDEHDDDPEDVPVHVAWSRVMRDIRKITKAGTFTSEKSGNYNFRGIDHTMNAFGPTMRRHGIILVPVRITPVYSYGQSKSGGGMQRCHVTVDWVLMGPRGDRLDVPIQSVGESTDFADKGTAKAVSVALRVLLLTLGMVPTGDPDPDSQVIEMAAPGARTANSYAVEVLEQEPSEQRLRSIVREIRDGGIGGTVVRNELDQEETLYDLVVRKGRERFAPKVAQPQPAAPNTPPNTPPAGLDAEAAAEAAWERAVLAAEGQGWDGRAIRAKFVNYSGGVTVEDAGADLLDGFAQWIREGLK